MHRSGALIININQHVKSGRELLIPDHQLPDGFPADNPTQLGWLVAAISAPLITYQFQTNHPLTPLWIQDDRGNGKKLAEDQRGSKMGSKGPG